jgi:hypothetical protein
MKIGVITSYFDRPQALSRYLSEVNECKENNVEWYLSTPERCLFEVARAVSMCGNNKNIKIVPSVSQSFGALKNIAAEMANKNQCDILIKQDIDCTCKSYNEIAALLTKDNRIVNVGVADNESMPAFGNEYCVYTYDWIMCGGEPEWDGYGWEDYGFIAKLLCYTGNTEMVDKVMRGVIMQECTQRFRDGIARALNQKHKLFMVHHPHEKITAGAKENRILFHKLIQDLIS